MSVNMKRGNEYHGKIDPDKVTDQPSTLPYPHTVGSPAFKPVERRGIKGTSLAIMEEQTQMQLDQIQQQVELLYKQASAIQNRVDLSQMIYDAEVNFLPVIGEVYHLYKRSTGRYVLSMIAPKEWGRTSPLEYVQSAKLLADRTWLPESDN